MMNTVLVEPILNGHRITYLRHYIQAFLKAGHNVFVLSPPNDELNKGLEDYKGQYHWINYRVKKRKFRFFSETRNKQYNWQDVGKIITTEIPRADLVFFMSLDTFNAAYPYDFKWLGIPLGGFLNRRVIKFIDRHMPVKWAGIYLTPNAGKQVIFHSRNNVAIGILEDHFRFNDEQLNPRIFKVPDVTSVEVESEVTGMEKKLLEKARGRKIVCLLGRIHSRKSVNVLLDAADQLRRENYYFIIAGEPALDSFKGDQHQKLQEALDNPPENCWLHFERIEDGHPFNSLLRASDIIFASYRKFPHSSNLLTKAAYFKKPIIVSENTYMGEMVKQYDMGKVMPEGSASAAVKAIKEISQSFEPDKARFDEYYAINSIEQIDRVREEVLAKIDDK